MGAESMPGTVIWRNEPQRRWHFWIHRQLLARPRLIPIGFGLLTATVVLALGILTLPMHTGFPFWLHGCVIALNTGVLVTGMASWLVREMHYQEKIRHTRHQAAELISHEICNSLMVLMHRNCVDPADRERFVDDAIARIRGAVRDVLPKIADKGPSLPSALVGEIPEGRRTATGIQ